MSSTSGGPTRSDDSLIAIIGASGRFPKAQSLEQLWHNLVTSTDAVTDLSQTRPDVLDCFDPDRSSPGTTYSKWGGLLDQPDQFDPAFFRISPREAEMMDPQQRILLETTWESLEFAGYADGRLPNETGVFVGSMTSEYLPHLVKDPGRIAGHTVTGNHSSVISNRVSFFLGLHGPSLTVDVACSSSLAALHLAVQSLRQGECPFAIVGATQAGLAAFHWVEFSRLGALSPTGRCRAFDASADGYVVGEGVGSLLLRPLSAALAHRDPILGVIRGVALGHGGQVTGLTVPSAKAQARVFRKALDDAKIQARDLTYIEAHGTGTPLGDPVEVEGLTLAFREETNRRQFCALGSIKSNIGHLESAAGMAGLLKVLLCFQHKQIPGNLHFTQPNPQIDFANSPFYLLEQTRPWQAESTRRAAVHASGFGGSVAFAILEEPPDAAVVAPSCDRSRHLVRLTAKTEGALRQRAVQVADFIHENRTVPLCDLAFSASAGQGLFEHHLCVHAEKPTSLERDLRRFAAGQSAQSTLAGSVLQRPKVAFLFTGQGAQRPHMGKALYETSPTFRLAIDQCADLLRSEFDFDLPDALYGPGSARIEETLYSQPTLFAVEYALTTLYRSWGIEPDIVLGHSLGEYAAAWAAGALDWQDALRLVARRGQLMQSLPGDGAMLVVFAETQTVQRLVERFGPEICVAAWNGPENVVVAGSRSAVEAFANELQGLGIASHPLNVQRAFHSPQVVPMLDAFEEFAQNIPSRAPDRQWITNTTGELWPNDRPPTAHDWRCHIAQPVQFERGLRSAIAEGARVFLEIGPGPVLSGMGRRIAELDEIEAAWIPSLQHGRDDWFALCDALARLDIAGVCFDGRGFDRGYPRQRVSLPPYPFERKRYWIGPDRTDRRPAAHRDRPQRLSIPSENVPVERIVWTAKSPFPTEKIAQGVQIVFADRDGRTATWIDSQRKAGRVVLVVRQGDAYRKLGQGDWTIRPTEAADFHRLIEDVRTFADPAEVVFAWSLDEPTSPLEGPLQEFVRLCQALTSLERHPLRVLVLADQSISLDDRDIVDPAKAAVWGLVRTLMHEYPTWRILGIDVPVGEPVDEQRIEQVRGSAISQVLALRHGQWWTRDREFVECPSVGGSAPPSGAVVISGGLGQVGLTIARALAAQGHSQLVLLSRSGIGSSPDRESAVRAIEQLGAQVHTPSVDVADAEALRAVLENVRKTCGPIVGVAHAAGVLADELIRSMSRDNLAAVLAPKALGAMNLHELTRDDPLQFFLLCSSIVALEGNVGQGSYAAANAFLDGLADLRRAQGRTATAVNWGPWRIGMAADPRLESTWMRLGLGLIDPTVGADRTLQILELPPANYVVCQGTTSKRLPDAADRTNATEEHHQTGPPVREHLEKRLREIFAGVLHLPPEEWNPDLAFKEYGLDSILAEEALALVRSEFGLKSLGVPLLFQKPTIRELAEHLASLPITVANHDKPVMAPQLAPDPVSTVQPVSAPAPRASVSDRSRSRDIAVIGYACRWPGADDADAFWHNLVASQVSLGPAPDDRWTLLRKYYPLARSVDEVPRPVGGWLTDIDLFDPYFFRIRPDEADHLDPRQRLLLEIAYRALEHAGYAGTRLAGSRTGTFVGLGTQDYALLEQIPPHELSGTTGLGSAPSIVASRLAYLLDLKGPCVPVDTACSSALVAIQLAMESLRRNESDFALAAAVHLNLSAYVPTVLDRMGVVSHSGVCRPFGDAADGLIPSEGAGALVLRRLDDALRAGDPIYAVLKGVAVNNDGRTNGIAAPNPQAQTRMLQAAWQDAAITPDTIDYIEAHGTATPLGDPVEVEALTAALGSHPERDRPCHIGSVKANVGHADIAAGMAGIIKVILALRHCQLPATPNTGEPNRRIDWNRSTVRLVDQAIPWSSPSPRRAGISAFGFAGTNAHVVLEEAPVAPPRPPESHEPFVVTQSARNLPTLQRQVAKLVQFLSARPGTRLGDIAMTLALGRLHHRHRLAIVASTTEDLVSRLDRWVRTPQADLHEYILYRDANQVDHSLLSQRDDDRAMSELQRARRIASDYVSDRPVDWQTYFADRDVRSTELPPSELEPIRCWVQSGESAQPSLSAVEPTYPMQARTWLPLSHTAPFHDLSPARRYAVVGPASAVGLSAAMTAAGIPNMFRIVEQSELPGQWLDDCTDILWIEPESDIARLSDSLRRWIPFAKGLKDSRIERVVLVTVAAQAVQSDSEVRSPVSAGIQAAARVLRREQPGRTVHWIDVDTLDAEINRTIVRLIPSLPQLPSELAVRNGRLFRPVFSTVQMEQRDRLKQRGRYWITGALGGLGRTLARWLAQHYGAELILSGRSPAQRAEPLLRELRAMGAKCQYVELDITQQHDVHAAVARVRENNGRIDGVFHLAGVSEHTRLADIETSSISTVVSPKVLGAWNLDLATRDDPPDLFVLFSSVAGLVGNVFQTNYSAASAWLDAFAAWRSAQGRPTTSLAFGPWSDVGMAARFATDNPEAALEPSAALATMRAAIATGKSSIVIARSNAESPACDGHDAGSLSSVSCIEALRDELASTLKIPRDQLDDRTSFVDFGMDSAHAVAFANRIGERLGCRLAATVAFDHPNLRRLAHYLDEFLSRPAARITPAAPDPASRIEPAPTTTFPDDGIAIVGMACRFPGASDPESFWRNLLASRDAVQDLSDRRFDIEQYFDPDPGKPGKTVSRRAGLLDDIDKFDADFFGISNREAELLDPQQRLLLELAWELLESAGYAGQARQQLRTGVFLGASHAEYLQLIWPHVQQKPELMDLYVSTGNNLGLLANRLSYQLDLTGPSLTTDTACSASLVSVWQAVQALKQGACDAAIAGGVNLLLTPEHFLAASRGGMLSPEGRCKVFDDNADGYVRSEGVGLVFLRRWKDALASGDRIYAVVRGAEVSQDGRTNGLTAPSGPAQSELLLRTWRNAGLQPASIGYVETHGTGTPLGDPIEVQALDDALRQQGVKRQSVAIGSVKTNIGHLEAAAGIASLIKAVLVVKHRVLPPTLHLTSPNRHIAFEQSSLFVNDRARAWTGPHPPVAAVSAFGMGGTNAHLVIESAPQSDTTAPQAGPGLFLLSARSDTALRTLASRTADQLGSNPSWNLLDACYTAAVARHHFDRRIAILTESCTDLVERLRQFVLGGDSRVWTVADEVSADDRWSQLARRFLKHEEVDWIEPFRGQGARKVALPGHPFERRRFWLPWLDPPGSPNHFYETIWQPSPVQQAEGSLRNVWLVLDSDSQRSSAIAESIRLSGGQAQTAFPPSDSTEIQRVASDHPDVRGLIVSLDSNPTTESESDLVVRQIHSFTALIQKVAVHLHGLREIVLLFDSNTAPPGHSPVIEPMRVLVESLNRDRLPYRFRLVATDQSQPPSIARDLRNALRAGDQSAAAYYHDDVRYVAKTVPLAIHSPNDRSNGLDVAMIVGGFGDIGYAIASHLANRGTRLILATRSGLARDRFAKIAQLEAQGAEVVVFQGDVAARGDVDRWFGDAIKRFGRIDLAIHAAGDTSAPQIQTATPNEIDSAFLPRVRGAENLLRHAGQITSLVFVASASTLHPEAGQGIYAASNACVDALARRHNAIGNAKIISIGFGPWQGSIAAESPEYRRVMEAEGIDSLSPQEALQALDDLLSVSVAACGVLRLTADKRQRLLSRPAKSTAPIAPNQPKSNEAPRDLVRRNLAEILRVDQRDLNLELSFDDLGLDSIMAMELCGRIRRQLALSSLPPTVIYEYPSGNELARYLESRTDSLPVPSATVVPSTDRGESSAVAIVGMAARFPGANGLEDFWNLLAEGREAIAPVPHDRWKLAQSLRPRVTADECIGGFLDGVDAFDPLFFRLSGREAAQIDPRHRLFLQTAYHALEHAGYGGTRLADSRTAVFVASGPSDYRSSTQEETDEFWATACSSATLASRLAYFLNLRGPCLPVDTACSSALTALHLAVRAIRSGEVDAALVGAVHLNLTLANFDAFRKIGVISKDGHCRPFSSDATGFLPSEGVAAVLLKPLERALADCDTIHGVILGSAMNNDGRSNGLTAPNLRAQTDVLRAAWKDARIDPADLDYLEAHGTGTELGDPIELEAIRRVLGKRSDRKLLVGSVKSNLGHAEAAAGMASLVKVLLALRMQAIPPTLHVQQRNPHFHWDQSALSIADRLSPWPVSQRRRIAGISAFGFSGTNVHVVLAEPPAHSLPELRDSEPVVLPLSARTPEALESLRQAMMEWLAGPGQTHRLRDIAATAALGRMHLAHRMAVWGANHKEWLIALNRQPGSQFAQGVVSEDAHDRPQFSPDPQSFAETYVAGAPIDWSSLYPAGALRQVPLPVYPFAMERFWREPLMATRETAARNVSETQPALAPREPRDSKQLLTKTLDVTLHQLQSAHAIAIRQFHEYLSCLDSLSLHQCARFIASTAIFGSVGSDMSGEELATRCHVLPFYKDWFTTCLARLGEAGYLQRTSLGYRLVRTPDSTDERFRHPMPVERALLGFRELVERFGANLPAVLSGHMDPVSLLFPEGDMSATSDIHGGHIASQLFAKLAQSAILAAIEAAPANQVMRILEVGAGTGGTTLHVLEGLPPDRVRYTFSDVSPEFFRKLEDQLTRWPGLLDHRVFDLNQPPASQGIAPHSFEIILATNVLHATRSIQKSVANLAEILVPGGLLLVTELIESRPWIECTFGLTRGWWAFQGDPLRSNSPLLGVDQWREVFRQSGIETVAVVPDANSSLAHTSQRLFVAGRETVAETHPVDPSAALRNDSILEPFQEWLARQLAETLELNRAEITQSRNFMDLGVDSILALQIKIDLEVALKIQLDATVVFEHWNLTRLATHLVESHRPAVERILESNPHSPLAPHPSGPAAASQVDDSNHTAAEPAARSHKIAIIGASGRFPEADSLDAFWHNICHGNVAIGSMPTARGEIAREGEDRDRVGGFLDSVECFDASFFGISPHEARLMDPQQRIFLETVWEAIERAGYSADDLAGSRCAVYAGVGTNEYLSLLAQTGDHLDPHAQSGNMSSTVAARVAYLLDLHAPAIALDTASSSSLVAVQMAVQGLRSQQFDMAIVGGMNLILRAGSTALVREYGMLSGDGRCRTFDQQASGFVRAEACGVVLLKRFEDALRDGDNILAVVEGVAANNDGSNKAGIAAPSPTAQSEVVAAALRDANVSCDQIGLVEAHGTATALGDPIEVRALTQTFAAQTKRRAYCAIGSVKSNIGHAESAAGIVGLIKAAIAVGRGVLPPTALVQEPNRHLSIEETPFYVNDQLRQWNEQTRLAGVSSFGFGGTNVHLVLAQPPIPSQRAEVDPKPAYVIPLSAKNEIALRQLVLRYQSWLATAPDTAWRDIAWTAAIGRRHHAVRLAILVDDIDQFRLAIDLLATTTDWRSVQSNSIRFGTAGDSNTRLSAVSPIPAAGADTHSPMIEQIVSHICRGHAERTKTRDNDSLVDQWTDSEWRSLLAVVAQTYSQGGDIDWPSLFGSNAGRRIELPTYPFQRTRHWLRESMPQATAKPEPAANSSVPTTMADATVDSLLHETIWSQTPLPLEPQRQDLRDWLVFVPGGPVETKLQQMIEELGGRVTMCFAGPRFHHDGHRWTINPDSSTDYQKLLAQAFPQHLPSGVLHLWSYGSRYAETPVAQTIFDFDQRVADGPRSLCLLAGALSRRAAGANPTRLVVATSHASLANRERAIIPERAAIAAILRSIADEEPGLICTSIDLDGAELDFDLANLRLELLSESSDLEVAYRQGNRRTPALRPVDLIDLARRNLRIRKGGCYLLTGGLGGLGIELAKWLIREFDAKVVLLGTRPIPTAESAESPMAGRAIDAVTRHRIDAIEEMRRAGGDVLVCAGNVADLESMRQVFTDANRRFGRVDGVFHLAGRLRDARVAALGLSDFEAVWQSKAAGAWVLDRLTRLYPPDWTVFFSSIASPAGSPGQAAYAGANRYLDALAATRSREGFPTIAIQWGLWAGAGMGQSAVENVRIRRVIEPMPTRLALQAIPRALELSLDAIVAARFSAAAPQLRSASPTPVASVDKPIPPTPADIAYDLTTRIAELLEVAPEQIDPNDTLANLGLDSILVARLTREMEARMGRALSFTMLRDYPTISAISEYLYLVTSDGY